MDDTQNAPVPTAEEMEQHRAMNHPVPPPDFETDFPGWVSHYLLEVEIGTDARFREFRAAVHNVLVVMAEKVAPKQT